MLSIVARIKVKPEFIDLVKTEMLKMVTETVKENGCINYNLHQDNADPSVFFFYENWSGEEALQNHLKSEHMQAYINATKVQIAEAAMNKLTKLA
jgi:quinol monooxygenase YgiN